MIATPTAAHIACFTRKRYCCSGWSRAITADALYTITMLAHTSRSVARNRILSDLSFLAIAPAPDVSPRPIRNMGRGRVGPRQDAPTEPPGAVSSHQSAGDETRRSQTGAGLCFPAARSRPHAPTDDCSPLVV